MHVGLIDPFGVAIAKAHEMGWGIVPLDKQSVHDLYWGFRERESRGVLRFMNMNLREKQWALKIKQKKAGKNDFVLVHQDHVEGLLHESGISRKSVIWVSKPTGAAWRRLSATGLEVVKAWRVAKREERRKNTLRQAKFGFFPSTLGGRNKRP